MTMQSLSLACSKTARRPLSGTRRLSPQEVRALLSTLESVTNVARVCSRTCKKAFELYTKAAGAGNSTGMNNVGQYYENGIHVKKDLALAVSWYKKSAEAGSAMG